MIKTEKDLSCVIDALENFNSGIGKIMLKAAMDLLRREKITAEEMSKIREFPQKFQSAYSPKNPPGRSEAQIIESLPADKRDQMIAMVHHMREAARSIMRMNLAVLPSLDPSFDVATNEDIEAIEEYGMHMIDGMAIAFLLGVEDGIHGNTTAVLV